MKSILTAGMLAISAFAMSATAFATSPMSPIPGAKRPALVLQAKCPQKNYAACVRVCKDKYKGTNCADWCGHRC